MGQYLPFFIEHKFTNEEEFVLWLRAHDWLYSTNVDSNSIFYSIERQIIAKKNHKTGIIHILQYEPDIYMPFTH